jgi:hypothetical protein
MVEATIDKEKLNAQTTIPEIVPATVTFAIPAYENFGVKIVKMPPKKAYAIYMKVTKGELV